MLGSKVVLEINGLVKLYSKPVSLYESAFTLAAYSHTVTTKSPAWGEI